MNRPKLLIRLIHINWILVTHGLDEIVLNTHLFRPIRFLAYLSPYYLLSAKVDSRAVRIRKTLEKLGQCM